MDGISTLSARIAAYLLIPLALLLLLPIVLVFVVGYYLFVLAQSARHLIDVLVGREDAAKAAMQEPHFLDAPVSAKSRPDDWRDTKHLR